MLSLAVLAEAPTDERVVRAVVEFLRGEATDSIDLKGFRRRGWPGVRVVLPEVVKHVIFRTTADALVIVADGDLSTIHTSRHGVSEPPHDCRVCELRRKLRSTLAEMRLPHGRASLMTAVGVAAPALEAWLLAGADSRASEAWWAMELAERRASATDAKTSLKIAAYGGAKAGEDITLSRAERLIVEALGKGELLRERFPGGFGAFADDIASWPAGAP